MTQTSNQNHENRKTPPVSVKEAGGSDNTAMGSRFRELLGILRRHDLVRGLTPEKLRAVLEDMGPTFIKLGQIMSTVLQDRVQDVENDNRTKAHLNAKID